MADIPLRVAGIDWENWRPSDRATLVFVIDGDRLLLIRKKRGLGTGKISAPGGRIEGDETPIDCAVREVQEELSITPMDPGEVGELRFQFLDGYALQVHVFLASGFEGDPAESDEAIPKWTSEDAIPYDEMWEDDRIWLPPVLAGRSVRGRFIFDGDSMLDHEVEIIPPLCQ